MSKIFCFLLILTFFGCNKPESHPENLDSIYLDMQSELESTTKAVEAAKKAADEHQADIKRARPQTGEIKWAQKRFWNAAHAVEQLEQQEKYWKVRIEDRRLYDRKDYLKFFKAGTPWPDPKEFDEYLIEKRLRKAKKDWDIKDRITDFKKANPGFGEAGPKAEGPKGEE